MKTKTEKFKEWLYLLTDLIAGINVLIQSARERREANERKDKDNG